jgi:hypothetical protein
MSFLTRWFKQVQNNNEDYEQILSILATDIQKRQTKLSELRLRERRSTLLTTLYTLALWGAYVSLWYVNAIPGFGRQGRGSHLSKALAAAPVLVGPIMCTCKFGEFTTMTDIYSDVYRVLFIRRVVQIWYKSKGDAEGIVNLILWPMLFLSVNGGGRRKNIASPSQAATGEDKRDQAEDKL